MIGQKQQDHTTPTPFTTSATPENLQGRQLDVYTTVKQHFESNSQEPLHIIINGTAGTGKSYVINCLRLLLGDSVRVAAPTGVASFIIEGRTLHSLLRPKSPNNKIEHPPNTTCDFSGNACLSQWSIIPKVFLPTIDISSMMRYLVADKSSCIFWRLLPSISLKSPLTGRCSYHQ